jgi:methyl-accepting chemotaxis protein
MTPRANTRDDIVKYVNSAASVVAKSGPSCDTFKEPRWMSGDWYIFVDGLDGILICHQNAQMVGRANADIVDANGRHVGDEIMAAGQRAEGHGWVDYVWPRPGQTTPVPKSTYVTRVTGPDGKAYIVGAGGYELR